MTSDAQRFVSLALDLGCTFYVGCDVAQLEASGIPRAVLAGFEKQGRIALRFDADYHEKTGFDFTDEHLEVSLGFDRLYRCQLPWGSILELAIHPNSPPEKVEDTPPGPGLRLV